MLSYLVQIQLDRLSFRDNSQGCRRISVKLSCFLSLLAHYAGIVVGFCSYSLDRIISLRERLNYCFIIFT